MIMEVLQIFSLAFRYVLSSTRYFITILSMPLFKNVYQIKITDHVQTEVLDFFI